MANSLSVVVEWENVKNSAYSRAAVMLRSLVVQLREVEHRFSERPPVLLVHDADQVAAKEIVGALRSQVGDYISSMRFVEVKGCNYYEQKNRGAASAETDLVLFVDSDIVPEEGWLEALLDCQEEEDADVVCGATHVETTSLYSKAFAGFWFFPMRGEIRARGQATRFFANNVLFKTPVFRATTFPDTGLVRGQCTQLADMLIQRGAKIYVEPRACVRHPPPNGIRHFVARALCHGHDNVRLGLVGGVWQAIRQQKWEFTRICRRLWTKRAELGLGHAGATGAIIIAAAYGSFTFLGELVSLAAPKWIGDHLRV